MAYKFHKYSPNIIFVIILRLIASPLIFISPWFASISSFGLDWIDGEIYKRNGYTIKQYKPIDSLIDTYWYICILLFINLSQIPGLYILNLLFIFRMIGQIIYMITQKREIFFLFPNFFEIFFFFYLFSTIFPQLNPYLYWPNSIYPLLVIIPIVLYREWLVHIKKANLSDFFTGKKTYWNK